MDWLRSFARLAEPDAPPSQRPLPFRRIVLQATGMWLVTRVAFLLISVLAYAFGLTVAPPTATSIFPNNPDFAHYLLPLIATHPILGSWVHWDASWYLLIGLHGYDILTGDSSGFFPLYPLAIRLLTLLFGAQAALPVALALSNLATLAAFIGLGLLGAHEATFETGLSAEAAADAPARLIRVTAAYPFAFFLFAPFTEGFFLAFIVFSFLCARRGWWGWAALCAALAGLTRPTAFALVPALVWEYGRQHCIWRRAFWRKSAWSAWRLWRRVETLALGLVVAVATPFGLGCYLIFLKLRYGHMTTPFTAQTIYHSHRTWPFWQTLIELVTRFFEPHDFSPLSAELYLDGGLLIIFLVITLLNVTRLPLLYTLYMLATIFFLLSAPIPSRPELIPSAGRYLLMATPIFLLLARWMRKRPSLEMLAVGLGFMLQALFALFFLTGLWIE